MNDQIRTFGEEEGPIQSSAAEFNSMNTVMDDLRESLEDNAEVEDIVRKVPNRPNIELVFHPDIEFDLLRSFMNSARNNRKSQFNPLVFAFAVIAKTNTAVKVKGRIAQDGEGTNITIVHKQFRDMLKAHDVPGAIRKLFGVDGHIISLGQDIIDAAGYGDIDMEGGSDPLDL